MLSRSFVLNGKTTLKSITETDPRNIEQVSFVIYSYKLYLYKYTYIQSHAVIIWRPGQGIFLKTLLYGALVLLNHFDEFFDAFFKFAIGVQVPCSPTVQLSLYSCIYSNI